ncbi:Neuronal acetylcholine receptor subunit alpha-4 [Lamellibrachia satsuma]|nr:Neuronal acetylcholine receptor subunit alpha-4 [Lamellibrachia satsuma]
MVITLLTAHAATLHVGGGVSIHQRLVSTLLDNSSYDKTVLPGNTGNTSIFVNFTLGLRRIINFDQKNQILTLAVDTRQTWYDDRLTWTPAAYNQTSQVYVKSSHLWVPDISVFDSYNPPSSQTDRSAVSVVYHTGRIYFSYPVIIVVSCLMHFDAFPYDRQACPFVFGTLAYNRTQLMMVVPEGAEGVDLRLYEGNSEWQLYSAYSTKNTACHGRSVYPTATFVLKARRRYDMLEIYIIYPIIMISIITVFMFLLPCDSTEKIGVGMGLGMKAIVYMMLLHDLLSLSDDPPPLVVFALVFMVQLLLAMVISIIVLALHYNALRSNLMPMPQWVEKFFLHKLANMIGLVGLVKREKIVFRPVRLHSVVFSALGDDAEEPPPETCKHCRYQTLLPKEMQNVQVDAASTGSSEPKKRRLTRSRSLGRHRLTTRRGSTFITFSDLRNDHYVLMVEQLRIMTEISNRYRDKARKY